MRPTKRTLILDAAAALYRADGGPAVTLESAARAADLTKPGLMYHFPTKDALMIGVVGHVVDEWESKLATRLPVPLERASPEQLTAAYVEVVLDADFDRADFAVFAEAARDPLLRDVWTARLARWFELPDDLSPDRHARLLTARLAADGLWIAISTGMFAPDKTGLAALSSKLRADLAEGAAAD